MVKKEIVDVINMQEKEDRKAKCLVEVRFDNGMCLSYLTDIESIEVGDLVTVEGKFAEEIGVIKTVKKAFNLPKFEMKWVESVLDRDLTGDYFKLDEEVISFNGALTSEKFITMFAGLKYKENQAIGDDEIQLNLANFEKDELFENELIKMKGYELFKGNAVTFISLLGGVGKAIVHGGEWYEIDFRYKSGCMTYSACDCPYFGDCKHEVALLYKLREIFAKLKEIGNYENFVLCRKECFNRMLSRGKGRVVMEL